MIPMSTASTSSHPSPAKLVAPTRASGRSKAGRLDTGKSSDVPSLDELLAWVVHAQRLKLITIKEVCERTGMGPSFVYAEVAARRFPQPVKLGASKSRRAASRFVEGEISDWIEQRIAERDAQSENAANEKEVSMN